MATQCIEMVGAGRGVAVRRRRRLRSQLIVWMLASLAVLAMPTEERVHLFGVMEAAIDLLRPPARAILPVMDGLAEKFAAGPLRSFEPERPEVNWY